MAQKPPAPEPEPAAQIPKIEEPSEVATPPSKGEKEKVSGGARRVRAKPVVDFTKVNKDALDSLRAVMQEDLRKEKAQWSRPTPSVEASESGQQEQSSFTKEEPSSQSRPAAAAGESGIQGRPPAAAAAGPLLDYPSFSGYSQSVMSSKLGNVPAPAPKKQQRMAPVPGEKGPQSPSDINQLIGELQRLGTSQHQLSVVLADLSALLEIVAYIAEGAKAGDVNTILKNYKQRMIEIANKYKVGHAQKAFSELQ